MTDRRSADIRVGKGEIHDRLGLGIAQGIFPCAGLTGIREPAEREIPVEIQSPGILLHLQVLIPVKRDKDTFRVNVIERTVRIVGFAELHGAFVLRVDLPGTVRSPDPHHTDYTIPVQILAAYAAFLWHIFPVGRP